MPLDTHTGFMVAASSVAFGAYFMTVKKTFKLPTKRLAWVLPTASALILGSLSLYELHRLGTLGWDLNRLAFTDSPVSRWGISIFLSSLLTDCFFGTLYYLDQFDPLSGWAHHTFYIGATLYALHGNFTSGMLIFMTSEFPTFILAMGHVMPELRSDLGFGLSFLSTRILYHAWLSYKTLMLKDPAFEVRRRSGAVPCSRHRIRAYDSMCFYADRIAMYACSSLSILGAEVRITGSLVRRPPDDPARVVVRCLGQGPGSQDEEGRCR